MGVLVCSRNGCRNIMCDRYSPVLQAYLCDECFEELVTLGPEQSVEKFLEMVKSPGSSEAAYARFNAEFPRREDVV